MAEHRPKTSCDIRRLPRPRFLSVVFPWDVERMLRQGLGEPKKALGPHKFPPPLSEDLGRHREKPAAKEYAGRAEQRSSSDRGGGAWPARPRRGSGGDWCTATGSQGKQSPVTRSSSSRRARTVSAPWGAQKRLPQETTLPDCLGRQSRKRGGSVTPVLSSCRAFMRVAR